MISSTQEKKALMNRINRIAGQVNGLGKMVEDDRECMEILNLVVSVQAALSGVWKQVVKSHLQHCIADAVASKKNTEELIDELVSHIERIK